jgi:hypothetical protein
MMAAILEQNIRTAPNCVRRRGKEDSVSQTFVNLQKNRIRRTRPAAACLKKCQNVRENVRLTSCFQSFSAALLARKRRGCSAI